MIEFLELKNDAEYNPLSIAEDAPLTQSFMYGKWQEMSGRKVRRFEIKQGEEIIGFFQAVIYPLVFSKKFIYMPHGPILTEKPDEKFWKQFKEETARVAKEENAIFARFDIFPKIENNSEKFFKKTPIYSYRSSYFQPKFEWILNLEKPEEKILSDMHPKTRYNIGLAERHNIEIEIISENFNEYFDSFYKLLEETAKRDNFNLHPKDYYLNILEILDSNNAFLAVARYDSNILLVNLVLLYGKTAYFIFGGSSGEHKNLMFSHLAQWESIKEAKTRGLAVYNFGGVQGSDKDYENYEGISVFKKRFGGLLLEYSDSYDLILKPLLYKLYNLRKWLLNLK